MVKHDVWECAGLDSKDGMLCIGCLEVRLERTLGPEDFLDCPINEKEFRYKSARLKNRLGEVNEIAV
jgi:hypothetical protein